MTMLDLDAYEVGNLNTVYYIPDYLDLVTEQCIINEVYASQAKWIQVRCQLSRRHVRTTTTCRLGAFARSAGLR